MTLYLKYRPKNLDELDLQDVSQSLKKILQSKDIPHAFLFAGPKGTGKTSAARILAKIINCENIGKNLIPCEKCEQCKSISKGNNLDVIEMDAASHRGIDDVRTLKDAVKLAPTLANKKIYIIDEAHMLTVEASNALLKTLEEPPSHVLFVLATTNPEKLIGTIHSRTAIVSFRKASVDELLKSVTRVAQAEKVKISGSSAQKIAEAANGAFRDAIKILEQVILEGEGYLLKYESGEKDNFINYLIKKDVQSALGLIDIKSKSGMSMEFFTKEVLSALHSSLLSNMGLVGTKIQDITVAETIELIDLLANAVTTSKDYPIESLPLELAVIKWCGEESKDSKLITNNERGEEERKKVEAAPAEEQRNNESEKTDGVDVVLDIHNSPFAREAMQSIQSPSINDDIWKNILLGIRPINASVEGLLRSAHPVSYDGKTLTLGVYYKFHKERLEESRYRKIVEDVITKVLNTPSRVVCALVDPPAKKILDKVKEETVLTETKEDDIIKVAEEIFSN